jgi:hypothetical protein
MTQQKQTLREAIEAEVAYMRENDGKALVCQGVANRLEEILARFPKLDGPTVRARVGFTVSEGGLWIATGTSHWDDNGIVNDLTDNCEHLPGDLLVFAEVDIPVPQPVTPITLEAEVSRD